MCNIVYIHCNSSFMQKLSTCIRLIRLDIVCKLAKGHRRQLFNYSEWKARHCQIQNDQQNFKKINKNKNTKNPNTNVFLCIHPSICNVSIFFFCWSTAIFIVEWSLIQIVVEKRVMASTAKWRDRFWLQF